SSGRGAMLLRILPRAAALLMLCVQLLHASVLPAVSSYEFTAYRMQQYAVQQEKHGCRGAIVQAEARSADEPVLTRRCVIMKLPDFTVERYLEALRQSAAAVLLLLPKNMSAVPQDIIQTFMVSESEALLKDTIMPVYVTLEDEQLLYMYEEVKHAAASRTSSILVRGNMVTATVFQILVSNTSPIKPITDNTIITLEGVLPGAGEDAPTIVITAHYDSYGLTPWLSYGADSNGSGVTILLELVRLFQKLYSNPHSQYHLLFSLTGGGKYNFLGTKRFIEENMDHTSLLHDNVAFVLCLDTLANGDDMFLHVSRPPKPGTPQHAFVQHLEQVVSSRFPWVRFGMVHKKINLGESTVSWEHERYAMRRIPGFTLSHLEDPKAELRGSILDTVFSQSKSGKESLARFMYNLSDKGSPKDIQVFKGQMEFQDSRMSSLMSFLTSIPRATQLDKDPKHAILVNTLEHELRYYLHQVHRHTFRQDKRYKTDRRTLVIKPAAFDLFLGGCIAAYLAIVYYAIEVGRHSQFTLVYIDCPFSNKPCHWIQKSAFSQRGY
uniref:BOS complex subunit NCLN n=1 Tax=Salmo trutta TaxID=8032 RepID=A0A673W6Z3_SALTR